MAQKPKNNGAVHMAIVNNPDYQCGIGLCRVPYLQRFATAAGFTGVFVLPVLATQTLGSYINSQIPTLEKQFALSSYESGIIMTFNDFGFLFVGLLVSSIPKLVHIPRWLFSAVLIFAVSGVLCCLPHFIIQSEQNENNLKSMTVNNISMESTKTNYPLCSEENLGNGSDINGNRKPRFLSTDLQPSLKALSIGIIGIGMVLQGAAKSIRMPFLTEYLDGVDKTKTGFYLGILTGAAIFGPALSYAVGGLFSRIYVTLEDIDMSTKDPRWIGAWWLGFLVFGIFSLAVAFPIVCFPRYLTTKPKKEKELEECAFIKDKVQFSKEEATTKIAKIDIFKERAYSYVRVLKSPVYVCMLLAFVMHMSSILGPVAFKSKYIEAQFGIPLWKANLLISGLMLVTVSIGTFVGGYITKRFKMSPRMSILLIVTLHAGQCLFYGSLIFLGCKQPDIHGPQRITNSVINSTIACNCDPNDFFPVCGSDGVNYHSPCYAGCQDVVRNGRAYTNCTMIPDGSAVAGLCPFDCNTLIPYLVMNVLGSASGSLKIMPMYIATIRSVEDRDKSTAAGLKAIFASLLAFIPAPIVFGKVIDTTCLIWNTNSNRKGACSLYNIEDLRYWMFGTSLTYKMAALIFMLIPLWIVWNISDWKELTKKKPENDGAMGDAYEPMKKKPDKYVANGDYHELMKNNPENDIKVNGDGPNHIKS